MPLPTSAWSYNSPREHLQLGTALRIDTGHLRPRLNVVEVSAASGASSWTVRDYLAAGLVSTMIDDNVQALGSSRPRHGFDAPGSEHAENRAVAVYLEVEMPIIGAAPPPPPPQDSPPPKSR